MNNYNTQELKEKIIERLKNIFDPEIPVNIYDLGLIYEIDFEPEYKMLNCYITMTLTSPACPVADSLVSQVKYVGQSLDEILECHVNLTFSPEWSKRMISEDGQMILELEGMATSSIGEY